MSAAVREALWYVGLFGLGVLPWVLVVMAAIGVFANAEGEAFGD